MDRNRKPANHVFAVKNLIFLTLAAVCLLLLFIQLYYGNKAPAVTFKDKLTLTFDGKTVPDASMFVDEVSGCRHYKIFYREAPDASCVGPQELIVVVRSGNGISTEKKVLLELIYKDKMFEVDDFTVYMGDAVSYRSYAKPVTDDVTITVDSSEVDLSRTGTYSVTYTATDTLGNVATKTVKVTVKEKPTDTLYLEVDNIIANKGWKSLSATDQAKAVFDYLRSSEFHYAGLTDKSDRIGGAMTFLESRSGDCFGFYALSRVIFERLGVETYEVHRDHRLKNGETHYWLLIKVNGEWYHFDACPQKDRIDSYLMTDGQLNEYNAARGVEYYNFDSTGLPARSGNRLIHIDLSEVEREEN